MRVLENHIFCLKDEILYAVFEEGGVLFSLEDRVSLLVNRTGTGILDLLDGNRDVKELARTLAGTYEQPERIIKEDISVFLLNLMKRGWLHVR